jgi:4-amino-4-deoxy-L-arabinose transferase-like glycosyltransferase
MEHQAAPAPTHHRSASLPTVIAGVAILVGIALRVVEFTRDRPLWLDEAMLALNIAGRPFTQLARPLDYDQSAPLLYLWIERFAMTLGGVSERTLRVLPFVAGVALVPLAWLVARRLAGATTAALAVVLVALSVSLVTFGSEGKQYGVDPLVTVFIAWLTARVADSPDDRTAWLQLVGGGLLALLVSQPAVFSLGGCACALAAEHRVRRSVTARRFGLVAAVAWSITFGALYVLLYRTTAQSAYMRGFWEGTFLDPRAPDFFLRLRLLAIAVFSAPTLAGMARAPEWLLAVAWIAGIVTLWRRRRIAAVLALTPLMLAVLACAIGSYAVMDRLFLFAAPLTAIAYASLLAWLVEIKPAHATTARLVGVAAALVLVAAPTHVERVRHPVYYAVGKQVIADVDSMSRGEPVYIAARSFPLWVYYTTDWRAPDEDRLRWAASIAGAGAPAHNNAPSRGRVSAENARGLARSYRGRVEIVGVPTGRQYRTSTRALNPTLSAANLALPLRPDTGWAELEVNRMASAAHSRLWVFGSHMFALDGAEPGLVGELQRRGVRLLMERRQGSTVAYRVEFPGEP